MRSRKETTIKLKCITAKKKHQTCKKFIKNKMRKDPRIVLFEVNILFQKRRYYPGGPTLHETQSWRNIPVLSSRFGNTCIVQEKKPYLFFTKLLFLTLLFPSYNPACFSFLLFSVSIVVSSYLKLWFIFCLFQMFCFQ